MRHLLISALMLAMTLPALAQKAMPATPEETVVILGYQIPAPVRVDEPAEWLAVREYVPDFLYTTPSPPMTLKEIYNEINGRMRAKANDYEAALSALAVARAGDYPGLLQEEIELRLAEMFMAGMGESISPSVQRLANEFSALQYLQAAFENELSTQGIDPTK